MSTPHYDALETKHAALEHRIADEEHRPHPDTGVIADLKKQKLRIKEEMATDLIVVPGADGPRPEPAFSAAAST